ncbi:MAG: hypothetical protein ACOX9B_09680 [Candidatus Xenobium sp.]
MPHWPGAIPDCGKRVARTRAVVERAELARIQGYLRLGGYPARPPPGPLTEGPPITWGAVGRRSGGLRRELVGQETLSTSPEGQGGESWAPPGWDDWEPA